MDAKQQVTKLLAIADIKLDGSRPHDITVHDPRIYDRWIAQSTLGLGESYMDGWWTSEKPDETLRLLVENRQAIEAGLKTSFSLAMLKISATLTNRQSLARSKRSVEQHYDIGNDLYEKMLDSNMQYSCGYWMRGATDLEQAQQDKLDLVAEKLKLSSGMTVLDIGCGWGGLASHLATKYGVKVTGITLSKEQIRYARERFSHPDINFELVDYRKLVAQPFDRIVSVGMMEHVGYKNFKTYMKCVHDFLKEDGLCLLHTIGDSVSKRASDPWIDKYIFPNGMLPSAQQIVSAIKEPMVLEDVHNFGRDYDKTLCAWHQRFKDAWPELKKSGKYDERFYKMWEYYLMASAGNFRASNRAQLWQFVLSKSGIKNGYIAVR